MADGAASSVPPRHGLAITSLVLGILSIPSFGCLIVGAVAGIITGALALARANREPLVYGGKNMAVAGIATSALSVFLIPFVAGFAAAIVIPSFLRARVSANESETLGDIRAVIAAEAAYQSQNKGYFGRFECLGHPTGCLPGYTGPAFLEGKLASGAVKSSYQRTFHPGEAVVVASDGTSAYHGSLMSFAYVAVPVEPGKTGVRGFCGDNTGRICFTTDGTAPGVIDGVCDPACRDR